VAGSFVFPVKPLGIDAVDLSHAPGEIPLRRLHEKMIVVVHETVGMKYEVEPLCNVLKEIEKIPSVLVVPEYPLLAIPP
jgi:hypothetical protein